MTPEQFTSTLKQATPEQLEALEAAYWRYISLTGLVSDVLPAEQVEADKAAYPQFVRTVNNMPVFNDAECVVFMAAISGLPSEYCEAWKDKDYFELHGETVETTAARSEAKES